MFGCGQLCFLSRQVAGFFDQQYYWKEPICIFDFFFLNGDNHHWKVTSETTTSWVGVTKGSRILWLSVSLEGINWYLCLTIFILSFVFNNFLFQGTAKLLKLVNVFGYANIYLLKVNNRKTRKWCKICLKLAIKTPELCDVVLLSLWSTLNIFHIFL